MENSKMHFKMYKSGKNWMVAGLMTTAVLAGLTLGNVNATEAHADANTPVAATSVAPKSTATSAEIKAASDNVDAKKTALNNANDSLAQAQSDYNKAAGANSNVSVISQDQAKVDQTSDAVTSASNAVSDAAKTRRNAKTAYEQASAAASNAGVTASGVANYNSLASAASASAQTASDAVASASAAMEAANQTIKDVKNQIDEQNKRIDNAYSKFIQAGGTKAMIKGTEKTPDKLQGQLSLYRQLVAGKKSLTNSLGHASTTPTSNDATGDYRVFEEKQYKYNVALNNFKYWKGQAADNADHATQGQKYLDDLSKAANALEAARTAESAANTNYQNAQTAYDNAKKQLKADRATYGVPTRAQVNAASTAAQNAETALNRTKHYSDYKNSSDAVSVAEKTLENATAARSGAAEKLASDNKALSDAKAAASATTPNTGSAASADAKVAEAQIAVDDDQIKLDNLDAEIADANETITRGQQHMNQYLSANNGALQKALNAYNDAESKYQALKKEFDTNLDPLKAITSAQTALKTAQANQAAAQKAYDDAVAYYNSLTGEKPATPSHTVNPGDTTVNPGDTTVEPGYNTNTDNNQTSNTTNESFTGIKNGEHFVNGKKVSEAEYNTYMASHKGAVAKSTKKAVAATTAKVKKLPQTGNDSAAVVALGALTGMLGLGLAAKKREF